MAITFPPFFADSGFLPGEVACPYALDGIAGLGGYLTGEPEHFIVDEIPAYAPVGDGEHWYIRIRKRGVSRNTPLTNSDIPVLTITNRCIGWNFINDEVLGLAGQIAA